MMCYNAMYQRKQRNGERWVANMWPKERLNFYCTVDYVCKWGRPGGYSSIFWCATVCYCTVCCFAMFTMFGKLLCSFEMCPCGTLLSAVPPYHTSHKWKFHDPFGSQYSSCLTPLFANFWMIYFGYETILWPHVREDFIMSTRVGL